MISQMPKNWEDAVIFVGQILTEASKDDEMSQQLIMFFKEQKMSGETVPDWLVISKNGTEANLIYGRGVLSINRTGKI